MSDSADILQQINDIDLSKVETSFPILAGGVVKARITDARWQTEPSKKRPGENNTYLDVAYALSQDWKTQPTPEMESKPVPVGARGSTLSERIYVGFYEDKKTGETKKYGIERVAQLRESAFGKAQPGAKFDPVALVSQEVTLRLTYNPAPKNESTGEVYGPRTEISGYVAKKVA